MIKNLTTISLKNAFFSQKFTSRIKVMRMYVKVHWNFFFKQTEKNREIFTFFSIKYLYLLYNIFIDATKLSSTSCQEKT